MTSGIPLLLFPLGILLVILLLILLIYFLTRLGGRRSAKSNLPDPRFLGSTAFLTGISGTYKDAVIPVPIEGIVIGSNVDEANIILTDLNVSSRHVRVSFLEGRYDSIVAEDLGTDAGTYFWEATEWLPLTSPKMVSQDLPVKIKVGANQDIFEIIVRS